MRKNKHESQHPQAQTPSKAIIPDASDGPTKNDLWAKAFQQLPPDLQGNLRARGMDEKHTMTLENKVEAFRHEAERLEEESKERDWKFPVKGQEIPIRDLTIRIVGWAKKIGDVAMPFAASTTPAGAVWGVVTLYLQEIQKFDTEKKALLSIAEKVAQAMFLGHLYSGIYTLDRTRDIEVVTRLHQAVVDLYVCVLKLLVKSSDLATNTVAQFCRSMFKDEQPSGMLLDLTDLKTALEEAATHCEVTANALNDGEFRELLKDTQLLQRQSFEIISGNERKEIRDWISKVPFGDHHENIEDRRNKDLGDWLIKHEKFLSWMQSTSSEVLWLQGSPGAGKTFLISNVVTYFKGRNLSDVEGFAYFFCNRDESDRRKSLPILQSLIHQLAATSSIDGSIRTSLRALWAKKREHNGHLSRSDCQIQLSESFAVYPTTFVVLDALDEVEPAELRYLLADIRQAISSTQNKIKLLVASRPEVAIAHNSWPTITIQAHDNFEDIKTYVEREINAFIATGRVPAAKGKKDEIIQALLGKCDNMFLWTSLQIDTIWNNCHSIEAIESVLRSLPVDLDEAYNKIYNDIQRLPGPDQELAMRALKWIYAAPQLLTTEEIISAIRVVQAEDCSLSFKNAIEPRNLTSICKNLLIVDSSHHWRFFHLSAREYLDNRIGFGGKSQETYLFCADVCFRSLLLSFDPQTPYVTEVERNRQDGAGHFESPFHPASPFSRHCQLYWPFYARAKDADLNRPHLPFLEQFLGSLTNPSSFYLRWFDYATSRSRAWRYPSPFVTDNEKTLTPQFYRADPMKAPIFLVAYFSLYETLREWCDNSNMTPLQLTEDGDYLLTIATRSACMSLCEALIAKGRDFDEEAFQMCLVQALVAAVEQGDRSMVEYLIKEGADVNLLPGKQGSGTVYSSPIDPAARSGNLGLVRYLVESAHAIVRDALAWASERESGDSGLDIVKYLIEDQRTDPNLPLCRHHYQSPLIAAVLSNRQDIVRYFLDSTNVDVNATYQTGWYGNALEAMISNESTGLEDLKYFIEKGRVDVNHRSECGPCGSALSAAVSQLRSLDMIKYLVEEAGAKVDLPLKVGEYGSPLAMAVGRRRPEVVYYLADHAEVNLPLLAGKHGSALAAAFEIASHGDEVGMNIVQFLIKAGGTINMQHQAGEHGSPFVAACFFVDDSETIQYLVSECKADIHARHTVGEYGNALVAAARAGSFSVAKYLIDSGEDANQVLQSGSYGSALAAAVPSRSLDVVKHLIDSGADANIELHVGIYGSPLAAAIYEDYLKCVRYLVERGNADVDLSLKTGSFGSALATAAANRNDELVEYLVEKGKANVNLSLETGSFGSALTTTILSPFEFSIDIDRRGIHAKSESEYDLALQCEADSGLRVTLSAILAPSRLQTHIFRAVDYLLNEGADVNLELQVGGHGNALIAATSVGDLELVRLLVEKGKADVKSQVGNGFFGSALVAAILADSNAQKLSPEAISSFWRMVSDPFHRRPQCSWYRRGVTVSETQSMVQSMISSMLEIMTYLLESGAPVDQQLVVGPYGSALAAAAAVGSLWNVKFLVEEWSADVNLKLENGSYANSYEAAVANGHDEIAEYLIQRGGNSETIGWEPLD